MLWREGLLIKLHEAGIGGSMFNWVLDFLCDRTIQVKIGSHVSEYVEQKMENENGTPHESMVSPTVFSLMINDIFKGVSDSCGKSLFADDGALWVGGRMLTILSRIFKRG